MRRIQNSKQIKKTSKTILTNRNQRSKKWEGKGRGGSYSPFHPALRVFLTPCNRKDFDFKHLPAEQHAIQDCLATRSSCFMRHNELSPNPPTILASSYESNGNAAFHVWESK